MGQALTKIKFKKNETEANPIQMIMICSYSMLSSSNLLNQLSSSVVCLYCLWHH